jgi:hypothetical protein
MNRSLTRRHRDDPHPADTPEIARSRTVDAVDAALRRCAGRRRFTRSEATGVLDDVRAQVDEAVLGPAVLQALDRATTALGEDAIVDGDRVADALLDLRLMVRS